METINPNDAMRELTMILMYLSRFKEVGRFALPENDDYFAWKGYDFGIINELDDKDYIRQGKHPSRSKSVYLTEKGKDFAKELMKKYHINDWEQE